MLFNKILHKLKFSKGDSSESQKRDFQAKRFVWALLIIWTIIILISLVWNISTARQNTIENATIQARIAYQKDIFYRKWNSEHGGVYVPVTDKTLPSPYLINIPDRDIVTPSGILLTMINPAYMTRQVHEIELETGILGHITSLDPIRQENAADEWETEALKAFETGVLEVTSLGVIDGIEYLRLMQPLIVTEDCLKCHAKQGYQLGDIRGGISASIPMEPLWDIENKNILDLSFSHIILLLVGFSAIYIGGNQLAEMVDDLIQSKQIEEERSQALEKSEEKIRSIVQDQTNYLVRYLPNSTITFFNKSYSKLTKKTFEELLGTNFSARFSKEEQEKHKNRINALTLEKPIAITEINTGGEQWEVWTDRGIFNDNGILVEVQSVGRDVTIRIKAEIELEKSRKAALSLMQDARIQSEIAKDALAQLEISQKDLEQRADELEMFNKSMVKREMRIIEMKEEVNKLRNELGYDPTYPTIWQENSGD